VDDWLNDWNDDGRGRFDRWTLLDDDTLDDDGVDEVAPGPNGTVVVDDVTADEAAVQADPAAVPGEQVAPPKN